MADGTLAAVSLAGSFAGESAGRSRIVALSLPVDAAGSGAAARALGAVNIESSSGSLHATQASPIARTARTTASEIP